MIPIPNAFYLVTGTCVVLATAAFIKVCYIWLRDAEMERKSRVLRDLFARKTYDEVMNTKIMTKRLCDELGAKIDDPECECECDECDGDGECE